MELLLFDSAEMTSPTRTIKLQPGENRTGDYWHVFVPGVKAGTAYGYRVAGPNDPEKGLRFDATKLLLDPYGRGTWVPDDYERGPACGPDETCATAMKSVVVDVNSYDWEGDAPPNTPWERTVIYEMHLAGFTRHPNSGVAADKRGTYAGIIDKIPYLVSLGVTAVELMPVYQFDEYDAPADCKNYWGYSPINFFSPHLAYATRRNVQACVDEFRDMVKAFHKAGVEVILDVVYNHTAEGNHQGPNLCFRGLANQDYYILDEDAQYYQNYSGTGNTFNCNNPIARRLIVDSLRYWTKVMHVDGFRFDLASILTRDPRGNPMEEPPVIQDIENDPELAGVKLIAEPWDAGGLYQVDSFPGRRWKIWNDRFRDGVRDFVAGRPEPGNDLPVRMMGSPDLFPQAATSPSINFVTAHDGFTLNDVVSYNEKRNEENGENNEDGHNDNRSWNCGCEGPTPDPDIEALRLKQVKNFMTLTLLSVGTPMLVMGDEVRRTQNGNNNAVCQNNAVSWLDWSLAETNAGLLRFTRLLIKWRTKLAPALVTTGDAELQPDGTDAAHAEDGRRVAVVLGKADGPRLCVMANSSPDETPIAIPPGTWERIVDTDLPSPQDIAETAGPGKRAEGDVYTVKPYTCVVLRSVG